MDHRIPGRAVVCARASTVISLCIPVYRRHGPPNITTVAAQLPGALAGADGELVVALNGITAHAAGVPQGMRTVPLSVNLGVAPGWNAAAAVARGDVLAFGNDDVTLGKGTLAMLERALAEHPEAGIVGPLGSRFDFASGRHVAWCRADGAPAGSLIPCDVVAGFLFAVRRADFDAIGGFDEEYAPATMEEIDLTLAMRHRRGLLPYAVAGVPYAHRFGISSTPAWRLIRHNHRIEPLFLVHLRNRRHFYRKWAGYL
jgi:GT2 family glycosyltransferase